MDHLTLHEYKILTKAIKLKQVDMDYRNHLQAFLNFAATAKKKNGRAVYTRFTKFFNYDKAVRRALNEGKRKLEGLEKILRREAD